MTISAVSFCCTGLALLFRLYYRWLAAIIAEAAGRSSRLGSCNNDNNPSDFTESPAQATSGAILARKQHSSEPTPGCQHVHGDDTVPTGLACDASEFGSPLLAPNDRSACASRGPSVQRPDQYTATPPPTAHCTQAPPSAAALIDVSVRARGQTVETDAGYVSTSLTRGPSACWHGLPSW
jgi:hypothetical protein